MIPGPNWARRYGNNPRRLCARPGCGSPAAATLRFQPTQREAWLVDLDENAARTEGDLCARHASALVLPRGWELHDERTEVPTVVAPSPPSARPRRVTTRGASVARARKRRTRRDDPQLPDLVAVPAPEPEPAAEPEPEAAPEPEPTVATEPEPDPEVAPEPAAASETNADASRPALDPEFSEPAREELNDALDAQTPLLKRAFSNVWPFEDE